MAGAEAWQTTAPEAAVVGRGVVLAYDGRSALAASDFAVPVGRLTALIGPNGSGKTTWLHAVAGLLRPRHGVLEVLGRPPDEVHDRVAYVLQTTRVNNVVPVTVREVVAMGRYGRLGLFGRLTAADRAAVDAALDRLRLAALAHHHLRELSAGERQRVFVAQGIVQEADLLLLDEPVQALDALSHQVIDDVVDAEVGRGTAIVLTTHDLAEARRADHVLVLGGRVLAEGPPKHALTDAVLAEAYGTHLLHAGEGVSLDDPHHLHEPPPSPPSRHSA